MTVLLLSWNQYLICSANQLPGFYMIKISTLTYFSPLLLFIYKPVIWFARQIKWLVSIWNATLDWNGLNGLRFYESLHGVKLSFPAQLGKTLHILFNPFMHVVKWPNILRCEHITSHNFDNTNTDLFQFSNIVQL